MAVTFVVLGHAAVPGFDGGYVGVDVFFVISGFLITGHLLRELADTGTIAVRAFYARRALRLLPASTLVVVATLAGAWFFLSKIRFAEYAQDGVGSALYAVNLRLAAVGTDYLAQGDPPSPFQHFWSLAVEEQFYLLWPALLLLCRNAAGRGGRRWLAAPLILLCAVSFGLSAAMTWNGSPWAYFGPHTRFWELGAGALLAFAAGRLRRLPSGLAEVSTWIGMGCIVLAALWFGNDTPYPGHHALLPVLGAALVVAGGCVPGARRGARSVLARKPAVRLGGLSYGWYLWHWPLLIIGPMALGLPDSWPLALLLGLGALLPAWLTLHLIENPVRFHPALRSNPGRALKVGFGLTAVAAIAALTAVSFPPPVDSGSPAPALKQALSTAADPQAQLTKLLASARTGLPANLTPPLDQIKEARSAVYRDGCHVDYAATTSPACLYGDRDANTLVVLFGDSHAAQWFPALDQLARERHWRLLSLTKASCKTAAVTTVNHNHPYTSCDQWRDRAIARITGLHPDLVLVASSEAGTAAHPAGDTRKQWTDGFYEVFDRLAAKGTSVATILDTPWPRLDAVDCAAAQPLRLSRCTQRLQEATKDPVRRVALRQAAQAKGVTVIDPEPWFCAPDRTCPVAVGNVLVYRDDSHISEAYAEALAPVLAARLAPLIRGSGLGRW